MVWQLLVKNWIRGYAADQFYKAASTQAEQYAKAKRPPEESDGPLLVDIGIVMSHAAEAGSLHDRMSEVTTLRGSGFIVHLGVYQEKRLALAVASDEDAATTRATAAIIQAHQPKWVIAAGFGTAIADDVAVGHVVLADQVMGPASQRMQLELNVDPQSLAAIPGVHAGPILSVTPDTQAGEKPSADANHASPLCADHHSFNVARVCCHSKTPCLAVCAITHEATEPTPADIENLHNQTSIPGKIGAATGAMLRRPSAVKDMWHDKELSLRGSVQLANFLSGMFAQLPGRPREDEADS